jgi:hypothetical protein
MVGIKPTQHAVHDVHGIVMFCGTTFPLADVKPMGTVIVMVPFASAPVGVKKISLAFILPSSDS